MTRTTPLRRITLHLSQIFFTLGRTFMMASHSAAIFLACDGAWLTASSFAAIGLALTPRAPRSAELSVVGLDGPR
jgi:hypothetical protein